MKTVHVRLKHKTPLLMHSDNIEWADLMDEWKNDSKNKKFSKAGDDRTPPWRWLGCLYTDGKVITIPSDNIMRCIMEGATQVLVPGGKSGKTFKSQSQSGLFCSDFSWPLLVRGNTISKADLFALRDDDFSFKDHIDATKNLGFSLLVKRAKIGQSKHIRVRPQFEEWSVEGEITITDSVITVEVLRNILQIAGQYKGIGDWRPGGKTPGPFGMFDAEVK